MGLKKGITDKVKEILDEAFVTEEVSYVPEISNSKLAFAIQDYYLKAQHCM